MKRLFIAINFPETIKKEILLYQRQYKIIPGRWVEEKNIHLTLIFLGYIKETKIDFIVNLIKSVASKHRNFDIILEKIMFGPPKQFPRMIWITIKSNDELKNLQKELEEILFKNGVLLKKERREYLPHITICRINLEKFKEIKDKIKLDENVKLKFKVGSIDLMESKLKKGGAEYSLIQKIDLIK